MQFDISSFDPQLSSTLVNEDPGPSTTYWCQNCQRRILNRFHEIHLKNCSPIESVQDVVPLAESNLVPEKPNQPAHKLPSTIPKFSIEERKSHLLKFEVLLLTPEQSSEFNEMFDSKSDCAEPLYSSWLSLKLATIPTEVEVINSVLLSHTAQNVTRTAKKIHMNVPVGPMRYDPSSSAWIEILEETEAKKKK